MWFGRDHILPEVFGCEDALILHGGWIQPQRESIEQPLCRPFANNVTAGAEELGGNSPIGWGFTTLEWYQAKAGYRIKLNGWSFVQPLAQYMHPDGATVCTASWCALRLPARSCVLRLPS
jgi:hypothetical protein